MRIEIGSDLIKEAFEEAWNRLPEGLKNTLDGQMEFVRDEVQRWNDPTLDNMLGGFTLTPDGSQGICIFDPPETLDRLMWVGFVVEELAHAFDVAIRGWVEVKSDPNRELIARFYALAWGFVVEVSFIDSWRQRLLAADSPRREQSLLLWSTLLTAWKNEWQVL